MLTLCVVSMTTLSLTNMKRTQDHVVERAGSSVLSTDGEISKDKTVTVNGSDLISSIIGVVAIDNRIPVQKDKVYSYKELNGTYQSRYIFNFEGETDENAIVQRIDPTAQYELTYEFDDVNNSARVNITKI